MWSILMGISCAYLKSHQLLYDEDLPWWRFQVHLEKKIVYQLKMNSIIFAGTITVTKALVHLLLNCTVVLVVAGVYSHFLYIMKTWMKRHYGRTLLSIYQWMKPVRAEKFSTKGYVGYQFPNLVGFSPRESGEYYPIKARNRTYIKSKWIKI